MSAGVEAPSHRFGHLADETVRGKGFTPGVRRKRAVPAGGCTPNRDLGSTHLDGSTPMTTLALTGAVGTVGDFQQLDPLKQAVYGFLARKLAPTTRAAYEYALLKYFAWCDEHGIAPLQAIEPQVELYLRCLEQDPAGYSESTISRYFGVVCGLYTYAARLGLCAKDPTVAIEKPNVDHTKQRCTFLPPVEFASLLKAAAASPNVMDGALMALIGLRGLRISEACGLDVESLHEVGGFQVLRYIGKGGKAHEHVLPVPAMMAVRRAIGLRVSGPILLNRDGNRMNRQCATRAVKRLADLAGVDSDISPHSMRRSLITTALVMGEDIYDVQRMVGHASPNTTQRYDRLKNDLNRDKSHAVAGFLSSLAG